MKLVGKKKGTLAGGKGQTPEMYYIGSDNDIGKDSNGNIATTNMSLTVSNVATHLSIMTELYKNSRVSAEGQKVVGDEERIAEQKAINSIQTMLSGLIDGENVEFTDNVRAETITAASTAAGTVACIGTTMIASHFATASGIGLEKLAGKAALRGVFNVMCNTNTAASVGATFGVIGVIAGGVAGGFAGAAVADAVINGSTKDFTDSDGNFMKTKAKHFKTTSVISGAGLGAGATALLTFGLASNPVGWTILGVGAAAGLVAWGIKSWWK